MHGDPRDVARAIVADPRYGGSTAPDAQPSLLERFFGWLGARLSDVAHLIGRLLGGHNAFDSAIGILVLAAVAIGLVALVYRLWPRATRPRSAPVVAVPLEDAGGSSTWLARALAAADRERWREASAALFVAGMHRLDEGGRLPYDPARTAGEARRVVNDPAFDAFARASTVALYEAHGATSERFAHQRDAYDAVS